MKNPESVEAAGVPLIGFDCSGEQKNLNIPKHNTLGNSGALQKDARVLHILKQECQRTGTGKEALSKVFTGLLSVHNKNLSSFAEALKAKRENIDG